MADYTALVEAGSSLEELLRDNLRPEPTSNRGPIALWAWGDQCTG